MSLWSSPQPMASGKSLGYSLMQNHLADADGGKSRSAFRLTGIGREEGKCSTAGNC
jgi:hypothetical protein